MPNATKELQVARIKDEIAASDAVWVVDYRGLTVKQSEALRGVIREQGAAMKVYKNSLTERAFDALDLPSMGEILEGPSAFVFVTGDPVASAKAIKTFAKSNETLEVKGGILDGKVISADQLKAIADLPSREELLAKLLGSIQNLMVKVVRVLNGPAEKFVRTLAAIAEEKAA